MSEAPANEAGESTASGSRAGGRLSVVATPIGNLDDITLRALRTLGECDLILAEDTRRSRILCAHHGVKTPLRAFHAHSSEGTVEQLADALLNGAHYALVSDAGTPLVSDPGARLCAAAIARGVRVEPIPGASAVLAALAASGLGGGSFRFVGFLPRGGKARRLALADVLDAREATVMFESPKRLKATLADLAKIAPERPAVVGRELTKLHEEMLRGTLSELAGAFDKPPRGEITLVLKGAPPRVAEADPQEIEARLAALLEEGMRTKDAARTVASELGVSVRDAYAVAVGLTRAT
ncbi:MAG: 16S rRNA (cytidine(1402)-2'-O)-methyltransferase [Sandaracinaceae bacterium]